MTESNEGSSCLPPTDMLYMTYEGNWLETCTSKVLSTQKVDETVSNVVLDQTVMHAQGGGQPTDKGQIVGESSGASLNITKVVQDRETGVATHAGVMADEKTLEVGETVQVKIDADLRRVLSECHTGM